MTVGELIEALQKYPKDMDVDFGVDMTKTNYRCSCPECEKEFKCRLDDWFQYKSISTAETSYLDGHELKPKEVVVIELEY